MTRTIACTFAAISLLTAFSSASAADYGHVTRHMIVTFGDLNLSQTSDANVLVNRLRRTANDVCGGRPFMGDAAAKEHYRECFDGAMNGAIAAVHSPLVAALYANPSMANTAQNSDERIASRANGLGQ